MNTKELRAIAEAATKGCDSVAREDMDAGYIIYNVYGGGGGNMASCCEIANINARNDAKYIAAFNPTTVLKLLDALDAAVAGLEFYVGCQGTDKPLDLVEDRLNYKSLWLSYDKDPCGQITTFDWDGDIQDDPWEVASQALAKVDEILGGET